MERGRTKCKMRMTNAKYQEQPVGENTASVHARSEKKEGQKVLQPLEQIFSCSPQTGASGYFLKELWRARPGSGLS